MKGWSENGRFFRKQAALARGQTERINLALTLAYDLDLQSPESNTQASVQGQRSVGSKVETDGWKDGRTDGGDCITELSNVVGSLIRAGLKSTNI